MGLENSRGAHDIKRRVADMLPQTLAKKWESHIRERALQKGNYTYLSDMASYGLDPDFPNEAQLHVHENLTRNSIEANRSLLEGLKNLAKRLQADPSLSHIQTISGYSWIVYNSPEILTKLGFGVSRIDHDKKIALATMGRMEFIRRFG